MKKMLFVMLSALFLGGCNRIDIHQPQTSTVTKLMEGDSVSQSFVAGRDNLNIVSICLRNFERALIPLNFSLLENNLQIRSIDFSSGNIDNEDCTRFQFSPVLGSAHHSYVAKISSTEPGKDKLIPAVFTVEKYEGDLHYKTFYSQPLKEVVIESLSQLPPRARSDWPFLGLWLLGLIYLLICLKK